MERWLDQPGPLASPATVILPRGAGSAAVTDRLVAAGIVDTPLLFRIGARLDGRDRRLKAGEYVFEPAASPRSVLAKIADGDVLLHRVGVPEGLTVKEVWAHLAESGVLGGELPSPPPEGTLLPETYLVPRGEPRSRVVERMRTDLKETLDAAWAERAPDLPLASPDEALVLASIIEKETAKPDEYGLVAAVFVNRLRRGMPLQTDPTVIYGLTEGAGPLGRPLTTADLAVDHAWNTYRIAGLPPSPIANPGPAAIAAAVRPADAPFLYFVADGTGGHAFAITLAEHNRNVARWRKVRREQNADD